MTESTRLDRLHERQQATLAALQGRTTHGCPGGLVPVQLAAASVVLDAVPADRAERIIDTYGRAYLEAGVDDLSTGTATDALLTVPAAELPRLRASLSALLDPPEGVTGWAHASVDALLADHPTPLALHHASIFGPSLPPPGLFPHQRTDLLQSLDAGTPATTLVDRHLAAHLLHGLARGPQRGWTGGWPCWTLMEAAVTHVQRRCAPATVFPTSPAEGLGGFRGFAMIGAYLALWRGERSAWSLALDATSPATGLGDKLGAIASLADLRVWLERGGANLGPGLSDPVAWLKLLANAQFGGPLGSVLRGIKPGAEATVADARAVPDLLAAAGALDWSALPCWRRPFDVDAVRDVIEAGVSAMFVEDRLLHALHGCPADPPGGELTLDVATCTLAARRRAHGQYTEPATWVLPPAWCGALHRRGLETLSLRGCIAERKTEIVEALMSLTHGDEALSPQHALDLRPETRQRPTAVTTAPAVLQLRHHDPVLVVGGALGHTLGEALFESHVDVLRSPFGVVPSAMATAAALDACAGHEPLPVETVVHDGRAWVGALHDPALAFASRELAYRWLDDTLTATRARLGELGLLLLCWRTAWHEPPDGPQLASPEALASATATALTALRGTAPHARVVLVIDPSRDPARSPAARHADLATLQLAARILEREAGVELLHAPELVADELGDAAWAADGTTLAPAAVSTVLDHLLDGWYAPTARAWIRRFRDDPRDPWLATHPFLPQPGPAPERAPLPEGEAEAPPPPPSDFDADDWKTRFAEHLDVGTYLRFDVQRDWLVGTVALITELPEGHTAVRLHALAGLDDKREDLEDPSGMAPAYERLLREVLPTGDWLLDDLVPPLKRGLMRRWIDDLDTEIAQLDAVTRTELAERLLDGKRPPRPGQILRTPLERFVVGLLASASEG